MGCCVRNFIERSLPLYRVPTSPWWGFHVSSSTRTRKCSMHRHRVLIGIKHTYRGARWIALQILIFNFIVVHVVKLVPDCRYVKAGPRTTGRPTSNSWPFWPSTSSGARRWTWPLWRWALGASTTAPTSYAILASQARTQPPCCLLQLGSIFTNR